MCATVLEISGSVKRLERTHPRFPHQYLSGCGAHRPASTTATPEIEIKPGLKMWWLHPRGSSRGTGPLSCLFPSWYSFHAFHPSRARVEMRTRVLCVGGDGNLSVSGIWNKTDETNSDADTSAAARYSSRCFSLLPVCASVCTHVELGYRALLAGCCWRYSERYAGFICHCFLLWPHVSINTINI